MTDRRLVNALDASEENIGPLTAIGRALAVTLRDEADRRSCALSHPMGGNQYRGPYTGQPRVVDETAEKLADLARLVALLAQKIEERE